MLKNRYNSVFNCQYDSALCSENFGFLYKFPFNTALSYSLSPVGHALAYLLNGGLPSYQPPSRSAGKCAASHTSRRPVTLSTKTNQF